jgi:predicted dehydrogenase
MTCALKFCSGALGTIVGTTGMFPGKPARIEVGGYNGTAVIEGPLKEFKFREARVGDEDAVKPPAENPDFMLANLQHIFDAWSAGRDAQTDGPECRKAVEIVLAMYESAAAGGKSIPCNRH